MDYNKLAQQYGGTTVKDYSALASQYGGSMLNNERNYTKSEIPGAMAKNFISDAWNLNKAVYGGLWNIGKQIVSHPIDSLKTGATGLKNMVAGAVMPTPLNAPTTDEEINKLDIEKTPTDSAAKGREINESLLGILERYGINATTQEGISKELFDSEQFKRQLAEHPAEALFDASIILSGTGGALSKAGLATEKAGLVTKVGEINNVTSKAAKASGMVDATIDLGRPTMLQRAGQTMGKIGNTTYKIGRNLDPITGPLKAGKYILGKGAMVGSEALGITTGMGGRAIRELYNTFSKGTAEEVSTASRLLKEDAGSSMTGVLGNVKEALYSYKRGKGVAYRKALADIKQTTEGVSFALDDVKRQAMQLMKDFNIKINPEGVFDFSRSTISEEKVAQRILETIFDWGKEPGDLTLKGLDTLKQRLDDFYSPSSRKTNRMSSSLRDMVKKKLDQATNGKYGEMTKGYQEALELEREIEKGLSLGNKTMADTAFRKLNTILKTNNEFRLQLLSLLEKELGVNLKSQIAAIMGSEIAPRGLMRTFAGGGGIAALASGNVQFLMALALTSPRLVAEFIKILGLSERATKGLLMILTQKSSKVALKVWEELQKIKPGLVIDDITKGMSAKELSLRDRIAQLDDMMKQTESKRTQNIYRKEQGELYKKIDALKKAEGASTIESDIAKAKASGMTLEEFKLQRTLRGTKGMTAKQITQKHPDIILKKDVPAKDIYGNKVEIPKGEELTPYELKGNKVVLQDGQTYVVSKGQFQNIKGNSTVAEAVDFAPELKGLEETVRGDKAVSSYDELPKEMKKLVDDLENGNIEPYTFESRAKKLGYEAEIDMSSEVVSDSIYKTGLTPTKYSQYQLPGGDNYKEILIKAPTEMETKGWKFEPKGGGEVDVITPEGVNKGRYGSIEEAKRVFAKQADTFKSSHWDEPNVISHLRLNDRTYKGKKVTFMEELQSDWARDGRSKGFIGDKGREVFDDYVDTLRKKYNTDARIIDQNLLTQSEKTKYQELFDSIQDFGEGVPSHPLVQGNKWQTPTIKRALREAVDNDSDYFAWITGEQTSARYNLSTQVDNVEWQKLPSKITGDKTISLTPKTSGKIIIDIDKSGKILQDGGKGWEGKKLDEVLGKGLADSIMAKPTGTLSGEGLKFGGEWADNLYDRQVKNIVEKITGAKAEKLDLGLPIERTTNKVWEFYDKATNRIKKLTPDNLSVGKEIMPPETNNAYIITDILGDGKFKAVSKNEKITRTKVEGLLPKRDVPNLSYISFADVDKKYFNKLLKHVKEETFDISTKTTTQQGIKLTPEIKVKIKGEALETNTSGELFDMTDAELKQLWDAN